MVVVDVEVVVAVVVFEVDPVSWRIAHSPTPTATRAMRAMMIMKRLLTGCDLAQFKALIHTGDLSADTGVTWYDRVKKGGQHEGRDVGSGTSSISTWSDGA